MPSFIERHGEKIKASLSGFDRVRFRGTIRWLANVRGMMGYLWKRQVRLKQFKEYAQDLTQRVREATERLAEKAGRPVIYLPSSAERKEDRARQIAVADRIREGLICVLTCVEPCLTFKVGPNAQTKHIELRSFHGKCLHQYFYLQHPRLGFLHVRLQTWLPFTVHVCLNGREWLAQELRRRRVGVVQQDNCFTHLDDPRAAQRLADRQLQTDWDRLLNGLLRQVHPAHARLFPERLSYYWSAEETEWATDLLFRSREELAGLYPRLVRHGLQTFSSRDVLRFLGRLPIIHRDSTRIIQSDVKTRPEGTRIKHQLGRNTLKMYDKQETVLRVETTINDPRDMKVYRTVEGDPQGRKEWRRLRKGVADLHRRAEVSQAANDRYLEALAAVDDACPLGDVAAALCRPTTWQGRRVRALNPLASEEAALLQAVSRGEFALNGFRNRDLRALLYGEADVPPAEARRQAGRITRLIRLLRGHKLVRKVPKTHRYVLTPHGRTAITALLAARQADTAKLTQLAA